MVRREIYKFGGKGLEILGLNVDIETWKRIGISVVIFVLFLGLRKLFTSYLFKLVLGFARHKRINLITTILEGFEKPIRWLFVIIGLQLALKYFPYTVLEHDLHRHLFRSLFIAMIGWGVYNVAGSTAIFMATFIKKFDIQVDRIIIPFVQKLIRSLVIVMAISIIAQEWGFNVSTFVAGLGIGGLAFALAAKDAIANLFGGIIIITEKPFTMGDWIKTPSVEGVVEDITFRSTKVRTFDQALVTVPNATLSSESIINWSKMGKRQVSFTLSLTYNTPLHVVKSCVEEIQSMLENHDEVDKETIIVRFEDFSQSSLDLLVYFFSTNTAYVEYLRIREDVNYKIIGILEKYDVSIAYPTQTLVVQQNDHPLAENQFQRANS
jgi:MscS family membrane protein